MRSLKHLAAVFAAATALALASGPGAAAADAHAAAAPRATAVCSSAAATGTVHGALSPAQVHQRLSSLTAQHRAQFGVPVDGPQRTAGSKAATTPKADIHPAEGTSFKSLSGDDGSCATQSVSTQLTVQDNDTTIYTPTMYPPGGSCVELVTVYVQGQRSVSAWDWCQSVDFAASVPINSAFLSTYTNGTGAYTGRVIRTSAASNTWSAALYDYTTGQWDTLFTQSGTNQSGRTDGWDIEELYSSVASSGTSVACTDMTGLTFESSNISVRDNGVWSAASSANADTHYDQPNSAFDCPDRNYQMVSAYTHWKVVG